MAKLIPANQRDFKVTERGISAKHCPFGRNNCKDKLSSMSEHCRFCESGFGFNKSFVSIHKYLHRIS